MLIVSVFTGAVAAVQAAYQFSSVVPLKYIGSVILRSVIIELGPVLTALIVGGRVGASIAAELGTMRVTEQIDALEAMAINPVRYLVVPRVVAAVVMLPMLVDDRERGRDLRRLRRVGHQHRRDARTPTCRHSSSSST